MAEEEIWKTHPDYPLIEVSNLGRIRTKDRYVQVKGRGKRLVKGRVLKQQRTRDGYVRVEFSMNVKIIHLRVNRAVATCFIPNPNNYPEVDHIDCDPSNNIVSNLRWCTHKENISYRDELGNIAKHNAPKKPVFAVNQKTFEVFWFESQREASRQLDANMGHINEVIRGHRKKTKGYWLCYADSTAVEKVRAKFGDEAADKVEKLMREHL